MKARQLIRDIEEAIEKSEEHDPYLLVNTDYGFVERVRTTSSPIEQGEQELYVILDLSRKV